MFRKKHRKINKMNMNVFVFLWSSSFFSGMSLRVQGFTRTESPCLPVYYTRVVFSNMFPEAIFDCWGKLLAGL